MGRLTISISHGLKQDAENTYRKLGMNLTTAIKLFLKQSVRNGSLPFEPNLNRKADEEREDEADNEANLIVKLIRSKIYSVSTDPNHQTSPEKLCDMFYEIRAYVVHLAQTMPFQYQNKVNRSLGYVYNEGAPFDKARPHTFSMAVRLCYEFKGGFDSDANNAYHVCDTMTEMAMNNGEINPKDKPENIIKHLKVVHRDTKNKLYSFSKDDHGKYHFKELTGQDFRKKLSDLLENV